jgi:hypothetical protein
LTYTRCCMYSLSSWWWAEKPPETCTASTAIKNIVQRCILLVILKGMGSYTFIPAMSKNGLL